MNYDIEKEIAIKKYMPNATTLTDMTKFFYIFSDNTRLRIIILLMIEPMCVGDICQFLKINQTTVSHQLQILRSENIVGYVKIERKIKYHIKISNLNDFFDVALDYI